VAAGIPPELVEALTRFDKTAAGILRSHFGPLEAAPPPPIIYHYTSAAGLRGILESGRLWLSDIFTMNDPSELKHGVSQAGGLLRAKAASGPPETKRFARDFADFYERALVDTAHYFVCSFSSDGDDLGQWRAYADDGRGYSLGFDGERLEDAFTKLNDTPIENNCTFAVSYNVAELRQIHGKLIDAMFGMISLPRGRHMSPEAITQYMVALSTHISVNVLASALFFKHEAYQNEKEFRFLEVHSAGDRRPPEVKERLRGATTIRYRELDWKRLCPGALTKIVVGPAADLQKAHDCLAEFSVRGVSVKPSTIPYRPT
jgi:Protein of unknown function (DUF2971)